MSSALGAGNGSTVPKSNSAEASTTSSAATGAEASTTSSAATGAEATSLEEILEAIKKQNKLINICDPPKDLYAEGFLTNNMHGAFIKPLLLDLFWKNGGALPVGFKFIGDTKDALKEALGDFIPKTMEGAGRLQILRETSTSGHNSKPSDLFVSQDSGPAPSKLINNPQLMLTPGTIMDSAGKTKKISADLVEEYGKLPKVYIDQVSLGDVIKGDVIMIEDKSTKRYKITIPLNDEHIKGDINAQLNTKTFKPASDQGDNVYFYGNEVKNKFIAENYEKTDAATINQVKKYILVKELGDTLQVLWLKYITDTSKIYTLGNSVITTGDTVVAYRCVINKVPVILTHIGKTHLYKAGNDTVMVASFVKTIREDTLKKNQSVIDTLKTLVKTPREATNKAWLGGFTWTDGPYTIAIKYLSRIIPKLENFNKDASIYFSKVTTIDAAKETAKTYQFENPFTLQKNGVWKINNLVTQIFDGVPFYAASFTPSRILSSLAGFKQVGGGQKGGQIATDEQKLVEAETLTTKEYFRKRLAEWNSISEIYNPANDTSNLNGFFKEIFVIGDAGSFQDYDTNEAWEFWLNNTIGLADKQSKSHKLLYKVPFFFYVFVKENFPQIFTYADMMNIAKTTNTSNNFLHYESNYDVEYVEYVKGKDKTMLGEMKALSVTNTETNVTEDFEQNIKDYIDTFKIVTREGEESLRNDYYENHFKRNRINIETFSTTWEAIKLTIELTDEYPILLTQELADFFAYLKYILPSEFTSSSPQSSTTTTSSGAGAIHQGGGPTPLINPITSKAIDYYELYYTLLVKASYENREVTNEEFTKEILKREKEIETLLKQESLLQIKKGLKTPTLKKSTKLTKSYAPSRITRRLKRNFINIPRMATAFGGKRRYKKTQKKKRKFSKRKNT